MWHHKTKLGTFWIIESEEDHEYYLGMDDETLGHYHRLEDAIHDIKDQSTGNLSWDESQKPNVPEDVTLWVEGEPDSWKEI